MEDQYLKTSFSNLSISNRSEENIPILNEILNSLKYANHEELKYFSIIISFNDLVETEGFQIIFEMLETAKEKGNETSTIEENIIFILNDLSDHAAKRASSAWLESNKKTLLHIALELGMIQLAEKLIDMGTDITAKDSNGLMPISYVEHNHGGNLLLQRAIYSLNNEGRTLNNEEEQSLNNVYLKLLDKYLDQHFIKRVVDNSDNEINNFVDKDKKIIFRRIEDALNIISLKDLYDISTEFLTKENIPDDFHEFIDIFYNEKKFKSLKKKSLERKSKYDFNRFSKVTINAQDGKLSLNNEFNSLITSFLNREDTGKLPYSSLENKEVKRGR